MPHVSRILQAIYWRVPIAWRLFPMLLLDAAFAIAFGVEAMQGDLWPPVLWPDNTETPIALVQFVGGYMVGGAALLILGLMACLSKKTPQPARARATYMALAGMWFLWTSYAVSLVMSVHHTVDSNFADGWSHVLLWTGETVFLGLVLAAAYFEPSYRYFHTIAHPEKEEAVV